MSKILNDTRVRQNALFSNIYWHDFFNAGEVQRVISECQSKDLEQATISQGVPSLNTEVRVSSTNFHTPNQSNSWIFKRLNSAIEHINDKHFHFDLYGFNSFQYAEYYGSQLGKYDFHMDLFINNESLQFNSTRKLSVVILLSEPGVDFEGGEFEINSSNESKANKLDLRKGSLIAFPSFFIHRVKPVTKGIRKSIAIWVEGPKFK